MLVNNMPHNFVNQLYQNLTIRPPFVLIDTHQVSLSTRADRARWVEIVVMTDLSKANVLRESVERDLFRQNCGWT